VRDIEETLTSRPGGPGRVRRIAHGAMLFGACALGMVTGAASIDAAEPAQFPAVSGAVAAGDANTIRGPLIAHNEGQLGSSWRSDLFVNNPHETYRIHVELQATPQAQSASADDPVLGIDLDPHQTVLLEDAYSHFFPCGTTCPEGKAQVSGRATVSSSDGNDGALADVVLNAATYNDRGAEGAYQSLGAFVDLTAFHGAGRRLADTTNRNGERYNVAVESGPDGARLAYACYDGIGTLLASTIRVYPPDSITHHVNATKDLCGLPGLVGGSIIGLVEAGDAFLTSQVTDNETNDSRAQSWQRFSPPGDNEGVRDLVGPLVAHAPGINSTWRSDLTITNPLDECCLEIVMRATPDGASASPADPAESFFLAGHRSVTFPDVYTRFYPCGETCPEGKARLGLQVSFHEDDAAEGVPADATINVSTYNESPDGRYQSHGVTVPHSAFAARGETVTTTTCKPGQRYNMEVRTLADGAYVRYDYYDANGIHLGEAYSDYPPDSTTHIVRVGRELFGVPFTDVGSLVARILDGDAYHTGQITDNETNDSRDQPWQRYDDTSGCEPGTGVAYPYSALPVDTDPNIVQEAGDEGELHIVEVDSTVPRRNRLFVFLSGTTGAPKYVKLIRKTAAQAGYHALGLSYINDVSVVFGLCTPERGFQTPAAVHQCQEDTRLEVIYGEDLSTVIEVDRANSIENRLAKLLDHVSRVAPCDGWGQYVTDGAVNWDRVIVAGHSQGSGHAAMIGKTQLVHGVLVFAGPEPSTWTEEADFLTPSDRFIGFVHEREDNFTAVLRAWDKMNFDGAPLNIDTLTAPYGSARLTTDNPDCVQNNWHGCPITDFYTPKEADGVTPVFRPVWRAMLSYLE
jgi:hypothetical protein